jgi:exodeoxyribonuclease VII large subunit
MQDLWVEGEISNFSRPSSGHLYFTLKDSQSAIRCVMWRTWAARLNFEPREGLAIEAHGGMGVYETAGQVQLYVDTIRPAGEGLLFQEFCVLKAKLEAEGLFDPTTKQPIPSLPRVIGIVTSPTGAALQDMLNTLRRRYPVVEVVLAPCAVQGVNAPGEIVAALAYLNTQVRPDVILIGRGGGSIEDLWAFNDEAVARAVAASAVPVISGVGHETDFTLTDFAADLRAPTPTAAAEVATPDKVELLGIVAELANRHTTQLNAQLADLRWSLGQSHNTLDRLSPRYAINTYRQRLDEITLRLERAARVGLDKKAMQLAHLQQSLHSLNPRAVLNRGYAIVTRASDGRLVKQADQVNIDDEIDIQVSQGALKARIFNTTQENKHDR